MNLNLGDTRIIIAAGLKHGLLRNQLAYVLATAYWETARTMKPVVEAYWLSEAWRKKNLRYYPWHGRGYVQLTWEYNYQFASDALGVDLMKDPSKALEPEIAAEILVLGSKEGWFTKKKLSDYITLSKSNFVGARRIINGTDKAQAIAEIAREYDNLLRTTGYGEETIPVVNDRRDGTPPKTHILQSTSVGAGLTAQIGNAVAAWQVLPQLDGLAQTVAIASFALVALALLWMKRERIRKFFNGDDR